MKGFYHLAYIREEVRQGVDKEQKKTNWRNNIEPQARKLIAVYFYIQCFSFPLILLVDLFLWFLELIHRVFLLSDAKNILL